MNHHPPHPIEQLKRDYTDLGLQGRGQSARELEHRFDRHIRAVLEALEATRPQIEAEIRQKIAAEIRARETGLLTKDFAARIAEGKQ